ncbi:hypothetical protein [Massilistercora timonensis]|uniref:hypothetical protein n=1 Tax=Massilistercora timonensis TaxID=2086584 RepID=UPI00320A598E
MMQQFHTQEYPTANRNYKDRLFRFVFKNKKDLLDLYNAINGTDYDNPEELEVNTLENVLYLSMKNDLSFLIDAELNLYEHQSTYNPNMPMRGLLYFAGVYNRHISDLFRRPNGEKEPCLECQTLMLNINYGHNRELMKKCRRLEEYAIFVDTIRKNQAKGQDLQEAVETAVESCIAGGVLADILRAQKAEVVQMVLEGFDQEAYEKAMKKEGYEDGYQEGKEDGYQEGIEQGIERGICGLIRSLKEFDIPKEQILQKLQDTYELTEEEAMGCIEKYW